MDVPQALVEHLLTSPFCRVAKTSVKTDENREVAKGVDFLGNSSVVRRSRQMVKVCVRWVASP